MASSNLNKFKIQLSKFAQRINSFFRKIKQHALLAIESIRSLFRKIRKNVTSFFSHLLNSINNSWIVNDWKEAFEFVKESKVAKALKKVKSSFRNLFLSLKNSWVNTACKKIFGWLKEHQTLSIFVCVFLVYCLLYFSQPTDRYILDFTSNKETAERVIEGNLTLSYLLSIDNIYGTFLYKLLVALNVNAFQYSLVFIKIGTFITSIIMFVFLYWTLCLSKKQLHGISFLLLAIFALDFLGIYEEYSSWNVKIVISVSLLSFCLFKTGMKKGGRNQAICFIASYFVQFLAFYFPFHLLSIIYAFVSIKQSRKMRFYFTKSLFFLVFNTLFALFVLQIPATEITLTTTFKVLESYIFPLTRYIRGDWTEQILYMIGSLTLGILLCSFISDFIHARKKVDFWLSSLFLVSLIYEIFLADKTNFASSEAFALNSFIFMLVLVKSNERVRLIKSRQFQEKRKISYPVFSVSSFSFVFGFFAIVISSIFAGSFCYLYQDNWNNMETVLAYGSKYDNGLIQDYLGAFGDNPSDSFFDDYDYFVENSLLKKEDYNLPIVPDYSTAESANFIRGVQKDNDGALWAQSNFAIELYANEGIFNLSLYSPINNAITVYINNDSFGTYDLDKGTNNLFFDVSKYYHQEIVVTGYFEKDLKGAMDRKGKWACPIINLFFSDSGGFFPSSSEDDPVWTSKEFSFYYPEVDESAVFSFYQPEDFEENGISVYLNGEFSFYQLIKPGMNDVFVNLQKYIDAKSDVFVTFKLDEVHKETYGERLIGLIYASKSAWVKEFSYDTDVTDYFMTLEPVSKGFSNISQSGVLTINGTDVREFELSAENMNPSFEMAEYLDQSIHIDISLSYGSSNEGFETSFDNYFGLLNIDDEGTSWTTNEFGFYYPEAPESEIYTFFQPESFGDNAVDVYVNGRFSFHQIISKGSNELFLDLKEESGKPVAITFKVETMHKDTNSDDMLGLYYISTTDWVKEVSLDEEVTGYFMRISPVHTGLAKIEQTGVLTINGNDSRSFVLNEDNPSLFIEMGKYLGQNIHVEISLSYGCSDTGFEASFADCYGFFDAEDGDSGWTGKEFGYYYPEITDSKIFTFYQPENFGENGVSVYVNGEFAFHQTIKKGYNNVFVDLLDEIGKEGKVGFVVDHTTKSTDSSDQLGLDLLSTTNWLKEISVDTKVSGGFMILEPVNKGLYGQTISVGINGAKAEKFVLDEDNPNVILKTGDYIDKKVHLDIEASLGCGGFDVSFKDYSGLLNVDADGSSWTKKEFAFYYQNVSGSKIYNFYQPDYYGENGVSIYVNGDFVSHQLISIGTNDVAVDLSAYQGKDVYVSFVVDSTRISTDSSAILGLDYIKTTDSEEAK